MINSVAAPQTVAVGENIIFTRDRVRTVSCRTCCGWLQHAEDSGLFILSKAGIYDIEYNADIASAIQAPLILQLKINGEPIPASQSIFTEWQGNTLGHVNNRILVEVPCGSSLTITLGNTSTAADIDVDVANIIIQKVG